ncbi:hypothetical protein GCM10007887_28830 [Methylobacterium haplocladii]|uniref:Uncharacterized protein n=2 Tax=Methylobacterium haplocladii TaxID=1176176 RepID=A0A512IT95_9HYPH|nr:hypothetical protein MHA02_32460 [Methylobacterium haplocladii]GLS60205.1 hypothetical protein GCM10007887_28830 [Methylobacterium haplocladii]
MQELLGLLTMVVDRVAAANARTAEAESRAARMAVLLDALSDENAALGADLEEAEDALTESRETIRFLRAQVEAGERLAEALEARAADAELRIVRASDALGLSAPVDPPATIGERPRPSVALH